MFTKNQKVRIKHTTIVGVIVGADIDPDTMVVRYKVAYTGIDGEPHERFFEADQLDAS